MTDAATIAGLPEFALTIKQPWASLIAHGAKPYEFRTKPPPRDYIGVPIAIHASNKEVKPRELDDILSILKSPNGWQLGLKHDDALVILNAYKTMWRLPIASIVGTAIIGRPVPIEQVLNPPPGRQAVSQYRYAWPMLSVTRLETPIRASGQLGIWRTQDGIARAGAGGA